MINLVQIFVMSEMVSVWDSFINWGNFVIMMKERRFFYFRIEVGYFDCLGYVGEEGLFRVSRKLYILWLIYLKTLLRVP